MKIFTKRYFLRSSYNDPYRSTLFRLLIRNLTNEQFYLIKIDRTNEGNLNLMLDRKSNKNPSKNIRALDLHIFKYVRY